MNKPEPSDGQLVCSALARDRAAADQLVRRHHGLVYSVALAWLRDHDAAQDLSQEVFMRAALHLDRLKKPESFAPWLASMTRKLAADWLKKGRRRSELVPLVPMEEIEVGYIKDDSADVRLHAENEERSSLLRAAITKLPDAQREIVVLHFVEEIDKAEMARRLGIHASTVGRQLERALEALMSLLPQGFVEQEEAERRVSRQRREREVAAAIAVFGGVLSLSTPARAGLLAALHETGIGFVPPPAATINHSMRATLLLATAVLLLIGSVAIHPRGRAVLAGPASQQEEASLRAFFEQMQGYRAMHDVQSLMDGYDAELIARHEGNGAGQVRGNMMAHLSTNFANSEAWLGAEIVTIERDRSWSWSLGVPVTAVRTDIGLSAYFHLNEEKGWRAIAFESRNTGNGS